MWAAHYRKGLDDRDEFKENKCTSIVAPKSTTNPNHRERWTPWHRFAQSLLKSPPPCDPDFVGPCSNAEMLSPWITPCFTNRRGPGPASICGSWNILFHLDGQVGCRAKANLIPDVLHFLSNRAFQVPFHRISILPVHYATITSLETTRTPTFSLLLAVSAPLPQIYDVPTLLHIQTRYIVYNVVRGVTEQKSEIRITPCWAPRLHANQTWRKLECRQTFLLLGQWKSDAIRIWVITKLQSYIALLTERIMTAFNLARADSEILEKVSSRHTEPNQIWSDLT